jgi:hypothetical protein
MQIVLDAGLDRVKASSFDAATAERLRKKTIPPEAAPSHVKVDGGWVLTAATEANIAWSFADEGPAMGHVNYLDYLVQCYAAHHNFVLTPDILWHTILCEIAATVASESDLYAPMFTTTPGEKQEITVNGSGDETIPVGELISQLRSRVPANVDAFLPTFSTTDELAVFTRYAAFADICSPYYNYSTMCCGLPAVDLRGDVADYENVIARALALVSEFAKVEDRIIGGYLSDKIIPTVRRIVKIMKGEEDGVAFFKDILTTKRCGSGSDIEVNGWWATSMFVKSYERALPHNTPSHIARVVWTNLETGRKFSINCGLFSSVMEDGFAVPVWGWVKNEIAK